MDETKLLEVTVEDAPTKIELNAETAQSCVRLIVGLLSVVATVFGWTIDLDLIWNILISAFALAFIVYGVWWKNQNITNSAQQAQRLLDSLKKDDEEIKVGGTD